MCTHCGRTNHTVDTYFMKHGYPDRWFDSSDEAVTRGHGVVSHGHEVVSRGRGRARAVDATKDDLLLREQIILKLHLLQNTQILLVLAKKHGLRL